MPYQLGYTPVLCTALLISHEVCLIRQCLPWFTAFPNSMTFVANYTEDEKVLSIAIQRLLKKASKKIAMYKIWQG